MVLGLSALAACSPETYEGLNPSQIPTVNDLDVEIVLDQEINQYTLNLKNKGVYPIWRVYTSDTKSTLSTKNGFTGIIPTAGTYTVEVKAGNRNGVSEGVKVMTFTFTDSKIDYAPYINRITGGESKTWVFASDEVGHLGCGESGTDGLNWWSAQPNDKAGTCLYDQSFIFSKTASTDGGDYQYNPGETGKVFVNTGVTNLPPYSDANPNDGVDYNAPAQVQNTTFQFVTEGTDLFLQFPAGTLLGYIPNNEAVENPKFKVNGISGSKVELTIDNGAIAWHYILGQPGEPPFQGFKYDSEFNLWSKAAANGGIQGPNFYYAPGWAQIANPETVNDNFKSISITLPEATTDTWQTQMSFIVDAAVSAANTYDYSCVLNSSTDLPAGATVKLCKGQGDSDDDAVFIFEARTPALTADQDYVFYLSDQPGIDASKLKMVFDFGGNAANTVMTVSNIVIKNHADDDGTVLPVEPDKPTVEWREADNLWKPEAMDAFNYYYAPGWNQIANPEVTESNGAYTINLPEATTDQWQAQIGIPSTTNTSADKHYDFRVIIESNQDFTGATIKFVKPDDDNVFYMADRLKLSSADDNVFEFVNLPGIDIQGLKYAGDFGGCPAGTVVTIKSILIQEHIGD